MSFNKNTQFNRMRKPAKRVLTGETPGERLFVSHVALRVEL